MSISSRRLVFVVALVAGLAVSGQAQAPSPDVQVFASCPVTPRPAPAFVPPAPYPEQAPDRRSFWFGTPRLWTFLRDDGFWGALPRGERGLRNKVFWWRPGFSGRTEPRPQLVVTGRRLGAPGWFAAEPATNASHPSFGGSTMLTMVEVPASGCWELTGEYAGESISFVVYVSGH
jgi:hypothetical protein